jgi:hypothetical protein
MPTVNCPNCGFPLKIPQEKVGTTGKCPKCSQTFTANLPEAKPPELPFRTIITVPSRTISTAPAPPSSIAKLTGFVGDVARKRQERKAELIMHRQAVIEAQRQAEMAPKPCPFCEELILPTSKKCKHCGEYVDPAFRPQAAGTAPQIVINNSSNAQVGGAYPVKRWEPGVAALLSLLIPGAGQIYKGQPINGLVWFILTIAGYFFLIVPGVVLHLCCVIGAAMGNPYR